MRRSVEWLAALERPEEGRLLLGVCAGLARAADIDVTLVRLAMVLLALASGVGVLIYLTLWLFVPVQSLAGVELGPAERVRANLAQLPLELRQALDGIASVWSRAEGAPGSSPGSRRWVGVGLIAGGALLLLHSLGLFAWLGPVRLAGLAAIVVGASLIFSLTPTWRR